jgi:hypothetical protein
MAIEKPRITSPPNVTSAIKASAQSFRSGQFERGSVDGVVQQIGQRHLLVFAQILSDAVEYDHRIVDE